MLSDVAQEEDLQRKLATLLAEHLAMKTALSMAQVGHQCADERRHEQVSFSATELLPPCPVVRSSHSPPMDHTPILQPAPDMDYHTRSGCACELSHDYLPHPSPHGHVGSVSQSLSNETWEMGPHCPAYSAVRPPHAPMWRPYDPAPRPLVPNHDQHTHSSSFLVGQLLDDILWLHCHYHITLQNFF